MSFVMQYTSRRGKPSGNRYLFAEPGYVLTANSLALLVRGGARSPLRADGCCRWATVKDAQSFARSVWKYHASPITRINAQGTARSTSEFTDLSKEVFALPQPCSNAGTTPVSFNATPLRPSRADSQSRRVSLSAAATGGRPSGRMFEMQLRSASVQAARGLNVK